jgi:ABC-type branched-subunit amino acid transport system ATPase component
VAFVARLADRVTVLDLGRVIASGPFAQIRSDPAVIAAYLGGPE